ncbi:transcriptional regulator [Nocardia terpenica]|uniref:Transcriptional regulator n=1 Tax=Nocardia terpenica TaxID=455432 RepID=A0A6G9ZF70_9NOCA|nr:transcriptional regulator [Nocardia terpenica]
MRGSFSPRLNGENKAHIALLAEMDTPLPPILVDRQTMRVIDGMHRLTAASLKGRKTIDVVFFEGSEADLFLRAVQENVAHGLPLTHTERRVAAERIVTTHPHMSDRGIGRLTGLAARTVAAIRKRTNEQEQANTRVGSDGKVRPLDSSEARIRAAELLSSEEGYTLRYIARATGISPATVLDVRKRLERGDSPVPEQYSVARDSSASDRTDTDRRAASQIRGISPKGDPRSNSSRSPYTPATNTVTLTEIITKLQRDPAVRQSERGRSLLRLFQAISIFERQRSDVIGAIPPHWIGTVAEFARHYSSIWAEIARELDRRERVNGPAAAEPRIVAVRSDPPPVDG